MLQKQTKRVQEGEEGVRRVPFSHPRELPMLGGVFGRVVEGAF